MPLRGHMNMVDRTGLAHLGRIQICAPLLIRNHAIRFRNLMRNAHRMLAKR